MNAAEYFSTMCRKHAAFMNGILYIQNQVYGILMSRLEPTHIHGKQIKASLSQVPVDS